MRPEKLQPDNFTPATRTPWGGTRILRRYKSELGLSAKGVVGESWEVSVEPSFLSRLASSDDTLAARIAADPRAWLGSAAGRHAQTPLLVKLVDAADDLSVQVHPVDGDQALLPEESGKPEAWIVLDADRGAGLYLGFREGIGRDEVEACVAGGGEFDELMVFVEVEPGDAFLIDAGTPHAIGAGVTLLEPQRVDPGKRGVTYRFWDWNRRYDAAGKPDPKGAERPLHLARSLEVTNWNAPRGAAFVASCRAHAEAIEPKRERCVSSRYFEVERWHGSGDLTIAPFEALLAVVCLGGRVHIDTESGPLELSSGESGAIPANAGALAVTLSNAHVFVTRSPE